MASAASYRRSIGARSMKPGSVRETLRAIGVAPVKTLGQNFLHDRNLARWIVEQADSSAKDYVLEIGPGLGALTEFVLASGAHVLALEKDARLANFLKEKFHGRPLEVHHIDALEFDVRQLFTVPKVKLLGNLPYNVASQLLLKFLAWPTPFSLVILTLQKEMAERLCAAPSTKNYGAFTLLIQFHYLVREVRKVPAAVFVPPPDVESAVVLVRPRSSMETPVCDYNLFTQLLRTGFAQRRKQLGKLIAQKFPNWREAFAALQLDPQVRGEALSLDQWVGVTNFFRPIRVPDRQNADRERFPVVDANDQVLGDAPRCEVHGNNLLHRAVHILIFGKNGEVYLQKRARWKDRHPHAWDSSAAGHVSAGEEYDEAARRELMEELGIGVDLERICKLPATARTDYEFVWVYRGRHEGDFRLNLTEIEAGAFFPPDVVSRWLSARPEDFAPTFAECWRACRSKTNS